ncbi:MAG: hypothetical protein ABI600_06870 [Luteolibacter sp.]
MTPTPPSPSEGSSLPPRHRPNLGDLVKDATELDLWAFDNAENSENSETLPTGVTPPLPAFPEPRSPDPLKVSHIKGVSVMPAPKPTASKERVETSVSKIRPKSTAGGAPPPSSKSKGDFDELDHWDDSEPAPELDETQELSPSGLDKPIDTLEPITGEGSAIAPEITAKVDDSDKPFPAVLKNIVPPTLLQHLILTKLERVGLLALLALLLIGAGSIVVFSLNRLPTEATRVKANDFPINGQYFKIVSAENYWRTPIIEGKTPDIIRRGTVLIPVIHLATSDGSAAVRVIFRNGDGESVGDTVTRAVQNGQELEVAATAGFDDVGMHAAYRTGKGKPWRIEVYEAKTVDSLNDDFKKLFEMNITTARR